MAESSQLAASPSSDPRFNYTDNGPTGISVQQLDLLASSIFDTTAEKQLGVFGLIVNGVKLALAVAYLIARERLVAARAEYDKQKYESGQAGQNQGDANAALPPGVNK